ncbi:MAG: hypothetical protein NC211_03615 [Alistipes senegalensis]|nr:hypothetical protein [Oxalobacter formigenes]MCM1280906.1 hypothetical protein [Alistipes senegalensis]
MIHFSLLRTRRLTVQLRELSIGESIAIASMPPHMEEAEYTAFLRAAVQSVQGIEDPADWTVQERMLAVCHYLAATSDDGPDFSLGKGRYTDYLDMAADIDPDITEVEAGELAGDVWSVRHLTGRMAEAIERLKGEVTDAHSNPLPVRLHWILGGMAAQMVRKGEDVPGKDTADGAFDEYLVNRMKIMGSFPESDFAQLMRLYMDGREKLHHLFRIEFNGDGMVALPKGGAADHLPPARFPVRSCLSGLTIDLVR